MNTLLRSLRVIAVYGTLSLLLMLILSACDGMSAVTPYALAGEGELLSTPMLLSDTLCVACDQATLAAALTQQKNSSDNQAAATAEIVRANAQATVNSANATLSAALTQEQSDANFLAAQMAATAEIVRANAQATVNSAGATQVAAMTQSQYNLQSTQAVETQSAVAILTQQNKAILPQAPRLLLPMPSPPKPRLALQHRNGTPIGIASAKNGDRRQSPFFGCGACPCLLCYLPD